MYNLQQSGSRAHKSYERVTLLSCYLNILPHSLYLQTFSNSQWLQLSILEKLQSHSVPIIILLLYQIITKDSKQIYSQQHKGGFFLNFSLHLHCFHLIFNSLSLSDNGLFQLPLLTLVLYIQRLRKDYGCLETIFTL